MPGVIHILLVVAFGVGVIFVCYLLNVGGLTHCSEVIHFFPHFVHDFPRAGQSFKPCLWHWFPQKLHILLLLIVLLFVCC